MNWSLAGLAGVLAAFALSIPIMNRFLQRDDVRLGPGGVGAMLAMALVGYVSTAVAGLPTPTGALVYLAAVVVVLAVSLGRPAWLLPVEQLSAKPRGVPPHAQWYERLRRGPTRREQLLLFLATISLIAVLLAVVVSLGG